MPSNDEISKVVEGVYKKWNIPSPSCKEGGAVMEALAECAPIKAKIAAQAPKGKELGIPMSEFNENSKMKGSANYGNPRRNSESK